MRGVIVLLTAASVSPHALEVLTSRSLPGSLLLVVQLLGRELLSLKR